MLTETCCQIDLIRLFKNGFSTGHGYVREPQSIITYAALACIVIQPIRTRCTAARVSRILTTPWRTVLPKLIPRSISRRCALSWKSVCIMMSRRRPLWKSTARRGVHSAQDGTGAAVPGRFPPASSRGQPQGVPGRDARFWHAAGHEVYRGTDETGHAVSDPQI